MEISVAKNISVEELRKSFQQYLRAKKYSENTVSTTVTDSLYLLRNEGPVVFWGVIESANFEDAALNALVASLTTHSKGNPQLLASRYLTCMKRFRDFLDLPSNIQGNSTADNTSKQSATNIPPTPCKAEVDYYLEKWDSLENYRLQENALDKLFLRLCPENTDLNDILIKVSTLNDFYSTHIYSVYPVAKHIYNLNIDDRLKAGDATLVNDIMKVTIDGKQRNFYSFATKYCSHHNPLNYPIYDSYVEKVLTHFRDTAMFSTFGTPELKNYEKFKAILIEFKQYYGLDSYNLKDIDKYIWQLGKAYFPKNYTNKAK